ncbi:PLP-dependent aminotransferase family protein, partial [Mesorhizobium sp. M00.F.Ca.ET.186.01.1.1]
KIVPEINDNQLFEEALRRGVVVAPGSVYGSDSGYIRFTFARPKEAEITRGVAKFASALRAVLS